MNERRKIIRAFILTNVWILFFTLTLSGVILAAQRTGNVMNGELFICKGSVQLL